jgi:hypothetical protein
MISVPSNLVGKAATLAQIHKKNQKTNCQKSEVDKYN